MKIQEMRIIFPPLLSTFILMNAIALFTTFMPLTLKAQGTSAFIIGIITAAYYLGMTVGAFKNTKLVLRIGHIRAFAAFASMITAAFLLNGLFQSVFWWILFRFIVGYCLAGLYIVIESWVLCKSTLENRGQALALYIIALNSASATGQFLLNAGKLESLVPFVIAGTLASLAIVPLATTKIGNPEFDNPTALKLGELFKRSPSGLITCFASGLLVSTVIGFLPLFLESTYHDKSHVALVMFAVLLGSVLFQFQIGRYSDQQDRRKVLVAVCLLVILLSLTIINLNPDYFSILLILILLFGGVVFAVYPLSISHACDVLSHDDIISATQGLLLVYGFGAVTGPLIMPLFMYALGKNGIFLFYIFVCTILSLYLYRRIRVSDPVPEEEQQDFISISQTSPIMAELDPRAEEDLTSSS